MHAIIRVLGTVWFTIVVFTVCSYITIANAILNILWFASIIGPWQVEHWCNMNMDWGARCVVLGMVPFWSVWCMSYSLEHRTGTFQKWMNWSKPSYKDSPYLIMSNHLGNTDPIVGRAMAPLPSKYVFKSSLGRIPIFGTALVFSRDVKIHFTSEKGGWGTKPGSFKQSVKRSLELVERGISIAVYPEGGRNATGRIVPFRPGYFKVSVENKIPILPCAIYGTQHTWPVGSKAINPGHIYAIYADAPIYPEGESVESLQEKVRMAIDEMLGMCPGFVPSSQPPIESLEELIQVENSLPVKGGKLF